MGNIFGHIGEEVPKHEVLPSKDGASDLYELRKYPAQVAAETVQSASSSGSNDKAFLRLAKYIGVFGNPQNAKAGGSAGGPEGGAPEPVAMTAPVVMQDTPSPEPVAMTAPVVMSGEGYTSGMTMQFILPSKYTMETAPKPTDPLVKVVQVPERVIAVHTFNGWANMKTLEKGKQEELVAALQKDGVKITGKPFLMGYNPPWTLGPWRKNEVAVEVAL